MISEPVLVGQWERVLGDLLDRTARFPKAVRHTLAVRLENHALDILEDLIEARFVAGTRRQAALRRADLRLARMRALVRIAHERRYLDHRGYEHVARGMDESGRMLGGWRKSQNDRDVVGSERPDPDA